MLSAYLLDLIILLVAAVIAVPLFQAARLGSVPGFLVAGVVVGPSGLGLIGNVDEISGLAEIGVVLLLFVIGIELKPARLWMMKRLVFGLGTLQVVLTGTVLGGIAHFLFEIPARAALLIGPALALSSTAFVLQLLIERKSLTSNYGRTSFAILLLQDLAVVPLLALVPLLAMPELSLGEDIGLALLESVLILGLVVAVGRYFLHPFLHHVALSRSSEVFTASAILIVLGTAVLTEHAGLSMAMGAFLAGLLISDSAYRHQIMAEVQPFRGLLLGLFFMSMGMSFNLGLLLEHPVSSLALVIALIVVKFAVLYPLARWFRRGRCNGMATALVLAQSGEFSLVLFSLAYQSQILTEILFQQLLLIVLLSMLATPILANLAHYSAASVNRKKAGRFEDREATQEEEIDEVQTQIAGFDEGSDRQHAESTHESESSPIVLAGYGRVGRRIGEILSLAGKPFVALDFNAKLVEQERQHGYPVFYGDVRQPEILKAAGAADAEMMIITVDDPKATQELLLSLREIYPNAQIYARGHSLPECQELYRLGAAGVVSENVEASLELAQMALRYAGVNKKQRKTLINDFRRTYHAQIRQGIPAMIRE